MADLKKYIVLSEINHNGKKYKPKDSIELEAKDADVLLQHKAILSTSTPTNNSPEKGAGNPAPVPGEHREYADKTAKLQIEYLLEAKPPKEELQKLVEYSKLDAKKLIARQLKELEQ